MKYTNGDMPAMPLPSNNITNDLTKRELYTKVIERIKHLQQQIKELKKAQDLARREQFAMAALQGLLADPNNSDIGMDRIANYAIEAADALLAKLDKDEGGS